MRSLAPALQCVPKKRKISLIYFIIVTLLLVWIGAACAHRLDALLTKAAVS